MSLMITEALHATYNYLFNNSEEFSGTINLELNAITGRKDQKIINEKFENAIRSYEEIQNLLSKLNEKESIRKSKGVYYTPSDVVNFIISNCMKLAEECLCCENMSDTSMDILDYKRICFEKVFYDPTCGAGEFLLAVLEMKFDLYDKYVKQLSPKDIIDIVRTIKGNDINEESTTITKLRLFLCVIKRYGKKYIDGISGVLNDNFENIDFVVSDMQHHEKYDAIVGNPPYVEDSKSGLLLKEKYGNIYANVLINACKILKTDGVMGFVIPLSYISTPRMKILREKLENELKEQWILSYADRPDCLFSSVHQKLNILIGAKKLKKNIYTGNYQFWYREERAKLFKNVAIINNNLENELFIPKLGNKLDYEIYKKISRAGDKSISSMTDAGEYTIYLNMRATFWIKSFLNEHDGSEYKILRFKAEKERNYISCILNSSVFWWFWICVSDCWHITKKELNGFMVPQIDDFLIVNNMAYELEHQLEKTKVYVGTKQVDYEYKHKLCTDTIHIIDDYINKLYGLTDEESVYIKEFAYRYRIGGGPSEKNN